MSAVFKNAKKKGFQSEFRRLMNEKNKLQKDTKLTSPLAKYNELGQLTCILCKSIVRSESIWSVHINSKVHRENVEKAKQLKEKSNNFTSIPEKRTLSPVNEEIPEKKQKTESNEEPQQSVKPIDQDDNQETLPEGFFDDPKLDAKARHQEYKNPFEEEWERFQREIKEANDKSAAIIAEDQEESTTERQIEEIDDQLNKLGKVLDFVKKKADLMTINDNDKNNLNSDSATDDNDEEFDEFLDWRSKKS